MDATILQKCLEYVGEAALSGITWDIMKKNTIGLNLVADFKRHFKKFFNSEEEAEECFERIATRTCNNDRRPFNDVETIYENCSDKEQKDFQSQFECWLRENSNQLMEILQNNHTNYVVNQTVKANYIHQITGMVVNKQKD